LEISHTGRSLAHHRDGIELKPGEAFIPDHAIEQ
jgi:hypothetical protein